MTDLHEVYVNETRDISAYRLYIEAALSYASATHSYEDVASMVAAGQAQFWPGPASCIVTELIDYPRKRVVHFFLASGTLPALRPLVPIILDWAKSKDCVAATFVGRRGWLRTFVTEMGWKESGHVLMEKAL